MLSFNGGVGAGRGSSSKDLRTPRFRPAKIHHYRVGKEHWEGLGQSFRDVISTNGVAKGWLTGLFVVRTRDECQVLRLHVPAACVNARTSLSEGSTRTGESNGAHEENDGDEKNDGSVMSKGGDSNIGDGENDAPMRIATPPSQGKGRQ